MQFQKHDKQEEEETSPPLYTCFIVAGPDDESPSFEHPRPRAFSLTQDSTNHAVGEYLIIHNSRVLDDGCTRCTTTSSFISIYQA